MTPDKLVSPATDAVPALPLSETGPATDVEIEAAPALPFAALGPVTLSPFFKLIFTSVVAIAGISLCASICLGIYLSYQPNNAANLEQIKGLVDTYSTVFKLGCGAVFGLIGGKAG
jgi:hypothetical protein